MPDRSPHEESLVHAAQMVMSHMACFYQTHLPGCTAAMMHHRCSCGMVALQKALRPYRSGQRSGPCPCGHSKAQHHGGHCDYVGYACGCTAYGQRPWRMTI